MLNSIIVILSWIWGLLCWISRLVFGRRSTHNKKVVCVIGGGFGGINVALQLNQLTNNDTEIVLIDPKDEFVFLPLLYELTTGMAYKEEVTPRFDVLFKGTKVKHIKGSVSSIDINTKTCIVFTSSGRDINIYFDQLVLGCGVQPRLDIVPGAAEHAFPFYTSTCALQLKERIKDFKQQYNMQELIHIIVIGGGCGGVEVAANIAEYFGKDRAKVTIIERGPMIMRTSADNNRDIAERDLKYKGVNIHCNTSVKKIKKDKVQLQELGLNGHKYILPVNLVILTSGTQATGLVKSLPLQKDEHDRIIVSPTLQVLEYAYIHALGDCSVVLNHNNNNNNNNYYNYNTATTNNNIPSTAQVAIQQSYIIAYNIYFLLKYEQYYENYDQNNKMNNNQTISTFYDFGWKISNILTKTVPKLYEFRYVNLGEMLSLGINNAAVTCLGGWITLSGPLAVVIRRLVYIYRMPTIFQIIYAFIFALILNIKRVLSWKV